MQLLLLKLSADEIDYNQNLIILRLKDRLNNLKRENRF